MFYNAGIIGNERVNNETFGYFPQLDDWEAGASGIELEYKEREADKKIAYYAPLEWFVLMDTEKSQTLLSKKLLFAVDYLSLKYPISQTDKTIMEQIKDKFDKYYKPGDYKRKVKTVRFLMESELKALLRHSQKDIKIRREILLPEPTYFAQISNRMNIPAFWLAGDMNDARRVDAATESLSEQKAGVELYYVRIVVEVDKTSD